MPPAEVVGPVARQVHEPDVLAALSAVLHVENVPDVHATLAALPHGADRLIDLLAHELGVEARVRFEVLDEPAVALAVQAAEGLIAVLAALAVNPRPLEALAGVLRYLTRRRELVPAVDRLAPARRHRWGMPKHAVGRPRHAVFHRLLDEGRLIHACALRPPSSCQGEAGKHPPGHRHCQRFDIRGAQKRAPLELQWLRKVEISRLCW
mmetsp:Transcript_7867/g.18082  ORF Transcript_7867/g.18082 Transcript_7867/m.18082 type:complete len:208 (-) Transcript_7867:13-636(-)